MPTRPLTPEQLQETLDAYHQACSSEGAARLLNMSAKAVRNRLKQARNPDYPTKLAEYQINNGVVIQGTSTLYDADGNVKLTWVKQKPEHASMEQALRQFIADLAEGIAGHLEKFHRRNIQTKTCWRSTRWVIHTLACTRGQMKRGMTSTSLPPSV